MQMRLYISVVLIMTASELAFAGSASEVRTEGAYVRFQGDNRHDDLVSLSAQTSGEFFGESGLGNITQLQASTTLIKSSAPLKDYKTDNSTIQTISLERRASLGISQTFSQLTSVGVNAGFTSQTSDQSKKSLSRWYSARFGQWWNKATILTELEGTKNFGEQSIISYMDTDGRRVLTPDRVQGNRFSLNLTWLASPQTMFLGSVTKVTSENRPEANSLTIEGRYFVNATLTGIHLKAAGYEDTAQVGRNTDYGRISAREWETQIHQHLSDAFILGVVVRDHYEREVPRSIESSTVSRHSRMIQGRLRYRFVTGPVTDMVPEFYIFTGQYQAVDSSAKLKQAKIIHAGIGGCYVL